MGGEEQSEDFVAGPGVEIPGGLVGKQQGGPVHEGARHRRALALAPGDRVRPVLGAVAEADALEGFARPVAPRAPVHATVREGQLDVLHHREPGQEVEALEDETDLLAPHRRQGVGGQAPDVVAIQLEAPLRGFREATHDLQERGLARARGTHDGEEFAPVDPQIDPAQGVDRGPTRFVALVQPGQFDHRRRAPGSRGAHLSRTVSPAARPESTWTRLPSTMPIATLRSSASGPSIAT